MPNTTVVFFQDDDKSVPFLEWFDELPSKVQSKCRLRIERLAEMGHELAAERPIICETGFTNCGFAIKA